MSNTRPVTRHVKWRPVAMAASLLVLSACADGFQMPSFQNPFGDRERAEIDRAAQPTQVRPDPDGRGVITYNTYQVIVARGDDTIPSMAQRVGLDPVELAAHNGLPLTYRPREGEVLALPRDVGGTPLDNQWSPDIISDAIDTAPLSGGAAATGDTPFQNGQPFPVIDPIRHRVEPGDTAYSIARLYGVSVTALASWNGLGSDLAVRENQELLIPVVNSANSVGQPTETQVAALEQQGALAGA
ncbi:MAG: LysM peptidoglycan-binding domain-containing protein, partial [Pseudomonadota bacterium]